MERGITSPVHSDTFDIDEEALKVGAGLMAWLAVQELVLCTMMQPLGRSCGLAFLNLILVIK